MAGYSIFATREESAAAPRLLAVLNGKGTSSHNSTSSSSKSTTPSKNSTAPSGTRIRRKNLREESASPTTALEP
ncbi:BZ3500_MvSof-1268-A1-R1_Chr2-1g04458 [Microbotryum saponariae]|uniref:BZ3500_MvSof-1268-A1-R1_Chr2-1g04458 protein n=1 Tax=Microbotryum saponariae TaxID=289078 RepID=A0A2X0KJA9_9BASI|nr:BZ3500_MvSof-1268-A1-R1_Chr2-1g04458 [Microbotryum saponariae]SCZ91768.1 BZ3501_MvSof-1269-A2-R1_Chr2-1g04114 [Microbotryum saponariae]